MLKSALLEPSVVVLKCSYGTMKLVLLLVVAIAAANAASFSERDGKPIIYHLKPGPIDNPTPRSELKIRNLHPRLPVVEGANQGSESKIINGNYAWDGLLPYQAAVTMHYGGNWIGICGGTIIGNEWIVTAAHCVDGGAESIEVGLGSVERYQAMRTTWAYIVYINGGWDPSTLYGDIALLKVQWFDYNERMAPAALPARNGQYSNYVNDWATVSGWGGINDNGDLTNQLKYTNVQVLSNSVCGNTYGSNSGREAILCASGNSICGGDSGGPLVIEHTRLLIGIVSFGATTCTQNFPTGFTRVTNYLNFIADISGISW